MNPLYAMRRLAQAVSVAINSEPGEKRIFTKDHRGGWGRNWFFLPGSGMENRKISGHLTPLPREGDEFHCEMESGMTGRFVCQSVKYCGDPPDQFFADVKFTGYVQ